MKTFTKFLDIRKKKLNEGIHRKLIELGVNKSQGYYFDEPRATLTK